MKTLLIALAAALCAGCAGLDALIALETALKYGGGDGYDYGEYGYGKTHRPAAAGSGEAEAGVGLQAALGLPLAGGRTSVYGLLGYHRFAFEGGHDHLLRVGAQARHRPGARPGRWWVGGEAAWIRDTSVYDEGLYAESPRAGGFSLGATGGYRMPLGALDLNLFAGIGLLRFGDFESAGMVVDRGGNRAQLRAGVEMALPFPRR